MFFPQLYTKTSYSLLQSTIRIQDYVQKARALGYTVLGITDQDVLYGIPEFYQTCIKEGIKPIVGMLLTYTYESQAFDLLVYAKDGVGYQQLMKLSSKKMIQESLALSEFTESDHLIFVVPPQHSVVAEFNQTETFTAHWQALKKK